MKRVPIALCLAACAVDPGLSADEDAKVTLLMTKDLAGIAGKEGTMVTVEYAPGGSSAAHRHNADTFVYVLEGSVVMQVKGGKEVTRGRRSMSRRTTFTRCPGMPAPPSPPGSWCSL